MTETPLLTGARLGVLQPLRRSPVTELAPPPLRLSKRLRLSRPAPLKLTSRRTLDFDVETVAAGYADPQWVPSTVTAWACSWIDSDEIECGLLPVAHLHDAEERRRFLLPLLARIEEAGVVTGHNILRFDLPILAAEVMRLQLPRLRSVMAQDTIRLPRTKGFKKGQDNLGVLLGVPDDKLPLNWSQWQAAYAEPDLATVRERVMGDVRMHKQLRERMRDSGWLVSPSLWRA